MLKIICISTFFCLPLVLHAKSSLEIPCYNEMYELMENYVEASEGSMNVIVKMVNEQGLDSEPQEVQITWKAPKETFTGATITLTMTRENGQCKVK